MSSGYRKNEKNNEEITKTLQKDITRLKDQLLKAGVQVEETPTSSDSRRTGHGRAGQEDRKVEGRRLGEFLGRQMVALEEE